MTYSKPIGTLDPECLKFIPKKYHAEHEFCFWLHDVMVQLLKEGEERKIHHFHINFKTQKEGNFFNESVKKSGNIIDYFLNNGNETVARKIIMNNLVPALFSDFLHFIYESLKALESRKFTVAYTLLRKPLRENLMFITWLRADSDDFYSRFKKSPAKYMESRSLSPERRVELFEKIIKLIKLEGFLHSNILYNIIYDKKYDDGFATSFDMATHLVTSHSQMMTEEINLNFIFHNPENNNFYKSIYPNLAYVLLYAKELMIFLYTEISKTKNKGSRNCQKILSLGSYESIFVSGNGVLISQINKFMKEFLFCNNCGKNIRLYKSNLARFLISQTIFCKSCKTEDVFPLYWFLSSSKKFQN